MAYQKGESGNPAGRPRGSHTATEIRKQIDSALPSILQTVIECAQNGDMTAAKLLIDRVCPTLKPQSLPINLPAEGNLVDHGNNIIQATLAGLVPPDIGSQLITALSNQGKLIEIQELSDRLQRIEQQLQTRT
jgi:Family of unknown function (DUF5681)